MHGTNHHFRPHVGDEHAGGNNLGRTGTAMTATTSDRYLDAFIARAAARQALATKDTPEHRQWLDDCNARLDELFDTRGDCE